jgi:hypothetical protein
MKKVILDARICHDGMWLRAAIKTSPLQILGFHETSFRFSLRKKVSKLIFFM